METVITFTPAELVGFITAIGGCIVTIGAVITLIFKLVNRIKAPETEQYKLFTQYFINDDRRFKEIEKSTKITQGAILALLKHALNGNNTKQLEDTTAELEAYLIAK